MMPQILEILTGVVVPITVAVFASTGFWTWFSQRKATNKQIMEKICDVDSRVDNLERKIEQDSAVTSRVRILRFNSELMRDMRHTREEFSQALKDIDHYEVYCKKHPEFPNNEAVLAIENIKRCYAKCQQEKDFL